MPADPELLTIPNVRIFAAGHWNGDLYTIEDLDAMVTAAREIGFAVPLKIGHTKEPGAPAAGWLANLRRVGAALVADLTALPRRIYDSIKQRSYDQVSCEIFWNLTRGGKTYPRVLGGLAILGAEIPAVSDLPALSSYLSQVYAITLETSADALTRGEAGAIADRRTTRVMAASKSMSRRDALRQVLRDDPALANIWSHGPTTHNLG
jgi:hypothetical protein